MSLGWHSPPDARRLLDRLDGAGIPVHAEFDDGVTGRPPLEMRFGFGNDAGVLVAVPITRMHQAEPLVREELGDRLPPEVAHAFETGVASGEDSDDEGEIGRLQATLQQRTEEIRTLERQLESAPAAQHDRLRESIDRLLQEAEQDLELLDRLQQQGR